MSNPTFGMRIDNEPFDTALLSAILQRQLGAADAAIQLIERGHCSADVDDISYSLTLLREAKCLVIKPSREPGWTKMFQICQEYSRYSGLRTVIHDEEGTHCVCINGESTIEQIYHTMEHDPYEAIRVMKELGIG